MLKHTIRVAVLRDTTTRASSLRPSKIRSMRRLRGAPPFVQLLSRTSRLIGPGERVQAYLHPATSNDPPIAIRRLFSQGAPETSQSVSQASRARTATPSARVAVGLLFARLRSADSHLRRLMTAPRQRCEPTFPTNPHGNPVNKRARDRKDGAK